jgi:hypothetical protein
MYFIIHKQCKSRSWKPHFQKGISAQPFAYLPGSWLRIPGPHRPLLRSPPALGSHPVTLPHPCGASSCGSWRSGSLVLICPNSRKVNFFFFFFETGSCYVVQADFELKIFLPQPPKRWDYNCAPPCHFKQICTQKFNLQNTCVGRCQVILPVTP